MIPMRGESDGDFLRRVGTDAMAWAAAMHERFPSASVTDLYGWCCNMIVAGEAHAAGLAALKDTK